MKRRVLATVAATAAMLAIVVPAQAQSAQPAQPAQPAPTAPTALTAELPTFEVGLGYQWLHTGEVCDSDDDCIEGGSAPLGFAVDGIRNFGALGILAEVGWSRDSGDFSDDDLGSFSSTANMFHYAGGVRWTGRGRPTFWPYGQVLVGAVTTRSSVDFDDAEVDAEFGGSDTATKFMVQPGIGATMVMGDGWGLFGQVDYRRVFLDEDEDGGSGRNDIRVFAGLRVILD